MFIFSIRASTVRFFAVLAITFAVLLGLILSGNTVFASSDASGDVNFSGVKTEDDRVAFIEQFGIRVKGAATESESFVMPENFDRVMQGYNEIQKAQGLDISKYAKKKVTRYTYELDGYEGYDGEVLVNLLVYRNRVIACDISSADPEGFIKPLTLELKKSV
ncbi:MAG: DUF4830 domain-containing protein [Clostridia bacterium]|nr:DUF4830 domain-containing protein [Clostridia bacterium]